MIGKAGEGATVIHRFAATQETSLSSFTHRSLSAGVGGADACSDSIRKEAIE